MNSLFPIVFSDFFFYNLSLTEKNGEEWWIEKYWEIREIEMYKCELRKVILTDDEIFDTTIQHFVESFDVEILFYKLMI